MNKCAFDIIYKDTYPLKKYLLREQQSITGMPSYCLQSNLNEEYLIININIDFF